MDSVVNLMGKIGDLIINPLIVLLFALALVLFLWGLAQFLLNPEDSSGRENAKRKIVWGVIGLFIMVSAYGILNIFLRTLGIDTI